MKKVLLLCIVLLLPSVFAITLDVEESYQPGETAIIEIAGNILSPIESNDIELKRGNVQVPVEYDIKRLGEAYYVYLVLPKTENNHTLFVRDIATTENGVVTTRDVNASIQTVGELVEYSLNPGFIFAQEEVELSIFLNRDFEQTITMSIPEETNIVLKPGANIITISLDGLEPGFSTAQIGEYTIPVFIIASESEEEPFLPRLRFFPRSIETTIFIGETAEVYPVSIINTGNEELVDVQLAFDDSLFILQPSIIDRIGPEETVQFNLSVKGEGGPIDDVIRLTSGEFSTELPILIEYTEDLAEVDSPSYLEEGYSETQGYYCSELGGKICTADESCTATTTASLDATHCCLGSCTISEESNPYAWIGYALAMGILVVLIIIGGRYLKKRKKSAKNPLPKQVAQVNEMRPSVSSASSVQK